MKKIFCIIAVILSVGISYGADKTITSKKYVENQIATKQDKIPAVDTNTVITHTGTNGNIGEKGIYDSSANFASQQTSLLTAGDANTGINNALETEFICVEEDTDGTCLIWDLRATAVSQLPSEYTRLEYLESTRTQWIDTGITQTNNIGVSVKYSWVRLASSSYIFGSYSPHYYLGINSMFSDMVGSYGPTNNNVVIDIPIDSVSVGTIYEYNINYNNSGMAQFVGQTPITVLTPKTFSSNLSMYMFAVNVGEHGAYLSASRIYNMQITDGPNLVRHFIPARRNSDNVLGMYDLVSRTFFTNSGTGTFVAGPVASYVPQNQ